MSNKIRMTPLDWQEAEDEIVEEPDSALWEYLWVASEVYDVPLTNNYPREQDGRYLRMVGDYLSDIRECFVRAGWRPRTLPGDADWRDRFPNIEKGVG